MTDKEIKGLQIRICNMCKQKQKCKKELCPTSEFVAKELSRFYQPIPPEGSVVLSKDNYNRLKRDSELYEARREEKLKLFAKAYNQGSKETAEKILNDIACMITCWDGRNVHINHDELVEFGKKYGVDLRVVEE